MAEYSYSSVQVNLPASIRKDIIAWGEKHIPEEDLYQEKGDDSHGRRPDSHVTVLYGIRSANPGQISDVLKGEKPIVLELGKISLFRRDDYDVVKVEVKGADLRQLHEKLKKEVPNTWDWPRYQPHVTIAYVKKGKADPLAGNEAFVGRTFQVNGFLFSSKDGRQVIQEAGPGRGEPPIHESWEAGFAVELKKEGAWPGMLLGVRLLEKGMGRCA